MHDVNVSAFVAHISNYWSTVTSGVPQGSVLGPLLFIIYLSDSSVCIVSGSGSYDDDLKLYSVMCQLHSKMTLWEIQAWTTQN